MFDRLAEAFGPQYWWPAATRFEVILGAYLTQNTSWKAAERSLANLREADALTLDGFRALSLDRLRELIRPSGFHTRKAPAIRAFVAMLDAEFGGSLEQLATTPTLILRRRLLQLPGVGPETADAILLYALNHPVPVVDEYLRRIVVRHGLIEGAKAGYEAVAELAKAAFAADAESIRAELFNEFHALVVEAGKTFCRREPLCGECPLACDPRMEAVGIERGRKRTPRTDRAQAPSGFSLLTRSSDGR